MQKVGCKRCGGFLKIRACWACGTKMDLKVDEALTRWQVNKAYEICCAPMPFKGNGQLDNSYSGNELIDGPVVLLLHK